MPIDNKLMEILVCPVCKSKLSYKEEESVMICQNTDCGRKYPVENDIPILLVDEATIEA